MDAKPVPYSEVHQGPHEKVCRLNRYAHQEHQNEEISTILQHERIWQAPLILLEFDLKKYHLPFQDFRNIIMLFSEIFNRPHRANPSLEHHMTL